MWHGVTQRRPQMVNQTVLGYYTIPDSLDRPLEFMINPRNGLRDEKSVWNESRGQGAARVWSECANAQSRPTRLSCQYVGVFFQSDYTRCGDSRGRCARGGDGGNTQRKHNAQQHPAWMI
jgi:hypothetical protein